MSDSTPQVSGEVDVSFSIEGDEALVLFHLLGRWFMSYPQLNDANPMIEHPAEEEVLSLLLSQLERRLVTPFKPDYDALVDAARARLAARLG